MDCRADERYYDRKRSHSRGEQDNERKRRRSRSPKERKHHHRDRSDVAKLPFRSHHRHKHDFDSYKALFSEYLDLQKGLDLRELDDHEVKGRWKSFLSKWNRGELAEGWYDPVAKENADRRYTDGQSKELSRRNSRHEKTSRQSLNEPSDDEDDGYGPALPDREVSRSGPAAPSLQDIRYRRELDEEDRKDRIADLRYQRKQDRNTQKERLDELAPRADPGSRERQMEKKQETTMSNRAFAEAKEAGAEEVNDNDLLGDDGGDSYKAKMRAQERQKNEREIRKEEVLRARAAEREEKLAEHRRKEAKTMDMLKSLAQQRFGNGN